MQISPTDLNQMTHEERRLATKDMPYEERLALFKEAARIREWNKKHRPKSGGVFWIFVVIMVLTILANVLG